MRRVGILNRLRIHYSQMARHIESEDRKLSVELRDIAPTLQSYGASYFTLVLLSDIQMKKISSRELASGKAPKMLAAFPRWIAIPIRYHSDITTTLVQVFDRDVSWLKGDIAVEHLNQRHVAIGLFEHIERFLLSGHSFLQCDSDFTLIEKRQKVTKAFNPSDLLKIVQDSKVVKPSPTARVIFP
ncbi:hypothetical protein ANN_16134 [Periplaneta americana]|uniref:Uncharacterized protein n=1 Tax=Periplaneta americana TaxID=6978 RepID=A0ABQ8SJH9_PERAM|nr:hypothetical protein ANN_16134 [Periplaneta americana]